MTQSPLEQAAIWSGFTRRIGLAALSLAPLLALGCPSESEPEQEMIRPVLVHSVELVSATQERTFPSRARAGSESVLSFRVTGTVKQIFVSAGETVREGSPIATLHDEDLLLELRRAEAGFAEASARDRNARSKFGRTKILHKNQAASDNQLDAAQTESMSTAAGLQAQAQAVALAKSKIGYAELRAPMDGVIATVQAEVNENIGIGDPVVTLNSGGRPEVGFTVPERLIGSIERGQPATVRFAALPEAVFPAEVVEVGVSSGRSAFPITARLLDSEKRIRSGMVAETTVRFDRGDAKTTDNVAVPAFAVAEDAVGRFVYVAVPSAAAGESGDEAEFAQIERRAVETGAISVEGLEIDEGLAVGDLVVTAGLRFIAPGMTVRIMER